MNSRKKVKKELRDILFMLLAVTVSFVSLHVFVIPANFSPSGIDGVSTILYELTGINIGWFKLFFNTPLMILAWIFLKKRHVFYVTIFTFLDSFGLIVLEYFDFYIFIPEALTMAEAIGYRLRRGCFGYMHCTNAEN